jgi:hypothetical protein
MQVQTTALLLALSLAPSTCIAHSAFAQETSLPVPAPELPSAPSTALPATAGGTLPPAPGSEPVVPQAVGFQPGEPLTLGDRFKLELRTTFGPSAYAVPAAQAALTMADPPNGYPHEWSDGPAAFGRNYGAEFARHSTGGLTHFAIAAALREDPRYYPSSSLNPAGRFVHAVAFTLVDRSDSGRRTIAASNLGGAAAAGFIGMAIYPDGFNDTTHAYQHAALESTSFVAHNLIAEFSPEITSILHKLHFPDRLANAFLPPDRRP